MDAETELEADFHLCRSHILRGEIREAAEIISFWVTFVSSHPEKGKQPIFDMVYFFVRAHPELVDRSDRFKVFIHSMVKLSEEGRVSDPTFRLN